MMLTAPVFLAALALLVPVLVTFLVRRRRKVIRVPSTMVWRLGALSVTKNRRVRNVRRLLALLACLGGVAALVIAAARPASRSADTTVYVVDVSASMAGGALAEAKRWLSRDVATRGPNARIAIVLAGGEATVKLTPSPPGPSVDEAIGAIAAESDEASIDDALSLAEGIASTNARVIVLSDGPVDAEASRRPMKAEQRIFGGGNGVVADNVGITGFFTQASPDARDDEEREASITLATSSNAPRRVRLTVDFAGQRIADRRISIPERGEVNERVGLRGPGHLVARVESDDGRSDALAIDNEASLEEMTRRPPRVALLQTDAEAAAAYFVAKAIRAAGVTDLVQAHADGPQPEDREVVVVLRDGKARPANVPAFFFGVEPADTGLSAKLVGGPAHLRSTSPDEPILRGIALDDLTIWNPKVIAPLARGEGLRALVELDPGPVLVSGGTGAGSWVWLGINPESSDLVLHVAFPVLMGNVLTHLGGASQIVAATTVPRSEAMLERTEVASSLQAALEPRWKMPLGPATLIAALGALLLALEAWLSFRRGWAT